MKNGNVEQVNRSFSKQAAHFENKNDIFSNGDYLAYTLKEVEPKKEDSMLEAAAGTCLNGRTFAPHVKKVVCYDATEEMLAVGRREAEKKGLSNMEFIHGLVEDMPFPDGSFDIVFSRLAFHHFPNPAAAFHEMVRVLKPGGKLVLVDMAAPEEELRGVRDQLERLRDPSHVRMLNQKEMKDLYEAEGLTLVKSDVTNMEKKLSVWLELTGVTEEKGKEITGLFEEDLSGGRKTGFSPYRRDGEICFPQKWILNLGIKN